MTTQKNFIYNKYAMNAKGVKLLKESSLSCIFASVSNNSFRHTFALTKYQLKSVIHMYIGTTYAKMDKSELTT